MESSSRVGILEQEADERFISDPRCNDRFEEFRRLCANVARYNDHSWLVTWKMKNPLADAMCSGREDG